MHVEKYICKNGIATPVNPVDLTNPPICFDPIEEQKEMLRQRNAHEEFETFAKQHTHHCSPSLVVGEYSDEMFGHVIMQEHLPFYKENEWTDCIIDGYDPIVTT